MIQKSKKVFFENIASLYGIQLVSYTLPLVLVPYLTRTLGAENWGIIAFIQSYSAYLIFIMEFGFNFSGTREVAAYRENKILLSKLFSGITTSKLFLGCICIMLTCLIQNLIPTLNNNKTMLWLALLFAFGQALSPMWFLQGIEQVKIISILDITTKSLSCVLTFLLVKHESDGWKYIYLQAVASNFSSIIASFFIIKKYGFLLPSISHIKKSLVLGWTMFTFRAAENLYQVGNIFLLGLFSTPTEVAFYAGAEKITKAVFYLVDPIFRVTYPRMSRLISSSADLSGAKKFAKYIFIVVGTISGLLSLAIFLFSNKITLLLLGAGFEKSAYLLKILSIIPFLISLKNIFGLQWAIPLRLDASINKIIYISCILHLILCFTLVKRYSSVGMSYTLVITEAFVPILIILLLKRKKKLFL